MSVSTSEAPKEDKTVKKDEGKKSSEEKDTNDWKGGELVWAKVPGFNYWPGKVFNSTDDLVPQWLKGAPEDGDVLIRFFGTYDMEWVSPKHVEGYQKGLKKKFQSKNKRKVFVKAVREAKLFVEKSELPEGMKVLPAKIKSSDESETEENSPPRPKRVNTRKATPANKKGRKKQKLEEEDDLAEDGKSDNEEEEEAKTTEQ